MKTAQLISLEREDNIKINDIPKPKEISGRQILVEVHSAGVNPIDWKIRKGYLKLPLPTTLGGDFSGVIVERGSEVTEFIIGDEIYGYASVLSGGTGSFTEYLISGNHTVSLKPKSLDHMHAAALPMVGSSAVQAIMEHINLKSSQKILIQGGAGGIGHIAIQIAKNIGAYVAATAKKEHFDFVKSLGADEIIDYTSQNFEELLKNYDAVLDNVGGETYEKSFKILKNGGIIVSMLEKANEELAKQYGAAAISESTHVTTQHLATLAELIDSGAVKVNIDKYFSLENTAEALKYLETADPKGKVVIKVK